MEFVGTTLNDLLECVRILVSDGHGQSPVYLSRTDGPWAPEDDEAGFSAHYLPDDTFYNFAVKRGDAL